MSVYYYQENSMIKRVQKEKKFFISQEEIKNRHPEEVPCSTDVDYAKFASVLRTHIEEADLSDLTEEDKHNLALNLAMYQEDVISEAGIWRAFTDLMYARYGKYVPFYSVDEEYLRDEPNLQDVAFIIWYTLIRHRGDHRQITNPETPALMQLAAALYDVLLEWFDKLPVNDDLPVFFEQAAFADDFEDQRCILQWFVTDCYLTYDMEFDTWLDDETEMHLEAFRGNMDSAETVAMRGLLYDYRVGPLALYPKEWLAAVLRANHNEKCAVRVESQEYRKADFVRTEKLESDGGCLSCEGVDGARFTVAKGQYMNTSFDALNIAYGGFVKYDGVWYANGDLVCYNVENKDGWKNLKRIYENKKKAKTAEGKNIMALIKKSGGFPFFFFETRQEVMDFLTVKLKYTNERARTYLSDADIYGHAVVCLLPESSDVLATGTLSTCLCDERNPYYDSEQAAKSGFSKALSMPTSLLRYAMEHNMLPDVGMNSVYGAERGQTLFRENYDLLQRAVMGNELIEG